MNNMWSSAKGLKLRNIKTKPSGAPSPTPGVPYGDPQAVSGCDDCAEQPVSPPGRLFLSENFNVVILCALEFRMKMELGHLRQILGSTLLHHPRFRSIVVNGKGTKTGRLFWRPVESVDISKHVFEAELLESEKAEPESAVEKYMGRLASWPKMDSTRPLWEAHLIHASRPKSQSTCVLRLHHALGDGTSLMSFLLAYTRKTNNPSLLPNLKSSGAMAPRAAPATPDTEHRPGKPVLENSEPWPSSGPAGAGRPAMSTQGSAETLDTMACSEGLGTEGLEREKRGRNWVQLVRRAGSVVVNTAKHMGHFVAVLSFLPDAATSIKADPRLKEAEADSPRLLAVTPDFSLEDIRRIRQGTGATVNDVMLTILALALDKYLELRRQQQQGNEEPGSRREVKQRPRRLRVTGVGLVNLRKSPGLQDIKVLMEHDGWRPQGGQGGRAPWGNLIGTYLLPLPMGLSVLTNGEAESSTGRGRQGGALKTLVAVKRMCDSKKLSLEAHLTYRSGEITMMLMGSKGAAALMRRLTAQTTLSISNMLGPVEEVTLGGNPISAISPTGPAANHALCCHFQSYNGQLKAVLCASQARVPDPQALCACFVDAFNDLKAAIE